MSLQPLLDAIERRHSNVLYPYTYFGENVLNRLVYEHADLLGDVLKVADTVADEDLMNALDALKAALKE